MAASVFSTKGFSNKSSMDCSNITALVLHNTLLRCVFKCDCPKNWLHNVLGKRIQDTTGGTLVTDNANFPRWLWRTLVFGRVQRLVCLKRRTLCSESKATPPANPFLCCVVFVLSEVWMRLFSSISLFVVTRGMIHSLNTALYVQNWYVIKLFLLLSSLSRPAIQASYTVYHTALCADSIRVLI